jgi:hypothetical protein
VPDRGHHGRTAGRHGPYELLVGERQQVLHAAAAPCNDDHVHAVERVQLLDGLHDLRHGVHALHGHVAYLETDGGPAMPRVLQHIPLGGRGPPADQPDQLRQKGQRLLPVGREQPLRGQRLLQLLKARKEFTDPDRPDLGGPQRQLPPRRVPLRLREDDHPRALADDLGDLVEHLPKARHAHRDVVRRVAQRQKHDPGTGSPRQLGDLPLDPHRTEPIDPPADEPGDLTDGERRVRSRVESHVPESNGRL